MYTIVDIKSIKRFIKISFVYCHKIKGNDKCNIIWNFSFIKTDFYRRSTKLQIITTAHNNEDRKYIHTQSFNSYSTLNMKKFAL